MRFQVSVYIVMKVLMRIYNGSSIHNIHKIMIFLLHSGLTLPWHHPLVPLCQPEGAVRGGIGSGGQ